MARRSRILVVDDDPITRDLIGTALRGQGYEEAGVGRLADALEAVGSLRPDLVVSDVVLPDGTGVDLARQIRERVSEAEAPAVVLVSAFSKNRLGDQRALKEKAGAVAFLAKPFAMPALLDLVAHQLALRPPQAEPESAPPPATPPRPPRHRVAPPGLPDPFGDPIARELVAVLATAWRRSWTGTLVLTRDRGPRPIEKRIVVDRGRIIWAATSLIEERLGRVLLRLGWLPRDQYEPTLREAARTRRRYGEVLVSSGLLAPWQLQDALLQQVEGIVVHALAWPEATYRIAAESGRLETSARLAASPIPRLVTRAFREVVGADRLDARLAAVAREPVALRPGVPPAALEQLAPGPEERRVLEALASPGPLDRALGAHPDGPEAARPFLAALLALGIAGPARGGEPLPLAPEAPSRLPDGEDPPAPPATEAAEESDPRHLEAEAAFDAGRQAVERGDLVAAILAFHRAVTLGPSEGEYVAWEAWTQALTARAAFDMALEGVAERMEKAAGLAPSSQAVFELVERVIRLRMISGGDEPK